MYRYDPANNNDYAPSVALNTAGDFDNGNVSFAAGAIIVAFPGAQNTYDSYTHIVWTAPTSACLLPGFTIAPLNNTVSTLM